MATNIIGDKVSVTAQIDNNLLINKAPSDARYVEARDKRRAADKSDRAQHCSSATNEQCGNCRYMILADNRCRRYPPARGNGFPTVYKPQWCGEWRKRIDV